MTCIFLAILQLCLAKMAASLTISIFHASEILAPRVKFGNEVKLERLLLPNARW